MPKKAIARDRGYYNNRIVDKGERFEITDEEAKYQHNVVKENERIRALPMDQQQKEAKEGRIIRKSWVSLEADLSKDDKVEIAAADRADKVTADAAKSEEKHGTARRG